MRALFHATVSPMRHPSSAVLPQLTEYVLLLARLLALGIIGAFATVAGHLGLLEFSGFRAWWLAGVALGALFTWLQVVAAGRARTQLALAESAASVLVVAYAGTDAWPLLVYLVVAPVFAGIAAGGWLPLLVTGTQSAIFGALYLFELTPWTSVPLVVLAQLGVAGLAFGAATSVVRRWVERAWVRRGSYAAALELLEQLSEISRQLPLGLSKDAVLSGTAEELREGTGAAEVAILAPELGSWVRLTGPDEADALLHAMPRVVSGPELLIPASYVGSDPGNPWLDTATVRLLPLNDAKSLYGVAALRYEGRPPWPNRELLRRLGEEAAARIGSAQVYAEVRERATAEERLRVSREIHDGVAQDLAALTYTLDNIARESGGAPVAAAAAEVRRLVGELRLSIFDLRTELGSNQTLGAAIGEYAQQVSGSTNLVVHTTVSDQSAPGDPSIQHEMLRICQEAVTNARRHSQASNLWIT